MPRVPLKRPPTPDDALYAGMYYAFVYTIMIYVVGAVFFKQSPLAMGVIGLFGMLLPLLIWVRHAYTNYRLASRRLQRMFLATCFLWLVPVSFGFVYLLISLYAPCLNTITNFLDPVYFSFVTITTLGYGDIQPLGVCKAIAVFEAMSGFVLVGAFAAKIFES